MECVFGLLDNVSRPRHTALCSVFGRESHSLNAHSRKYHDQNHNFKAMYRIDYIAEIFL